MSETDSTDDGFDLFEAVREDPPRIQEPDQLEAVARLRLGNAMYVQETVALDDDQYIGYLGVCKPTDTSAAAGAPEMTFLNYAPVGALVATPTGDGEYTVRSPTRDKVSVAIRARERRENDHRATVLPPVRNRLRDAVDEHSEKREDSSAEFRKGVHTGMARMADIVLRELMGRWNAPYHGEHRWQSDESMEDA